VKFVEKLLASIIHLGWTSIALFLSFIIIYFFDEDPGNQFLLLPEWSLLAFFTLMTTLKKQEVICKYQENTEFKLETAKNMFNFLSVVCILLFVLSLMAGRKYINLENHQEEMLMFSNVLLFACSCLLFISAIFQEAKFVKIPNKALKSDS
jgi:hypothetical protein